MTSIAEGLTTDHRHALLNVARDSIARGLQSGQPLAVDLERMPEPFQAVAATFVTLQRQGRLRGCIGTLEARAPLAVDVAHNAFMAAFRDRRFPPMRVDELIDVEVHISILGEPEPMGFKNEDDLVSQLRPGVDGLILQEGAHRGTFLPSVWEQIPDPQTFLGQLKRKAGLPTDYWSATLCVDRYTTDSIP